MESYNFRKLYVEGQAPTKIEIILFYFFKTMYFLLNGAEHKVEVYGSYVLVDNTQFSLKGKNWNEAHHRASHVYTFHFKTHTMEIGKDYQAWYDEDQLPVYFEDWEVKRMGLYKDGNTTWIRQNIKKIIINHTVYKIESASYIWPRPKLYLNDKHVGYIREREVEWTEPTVPYLPHNMS